MGLLQEYLCPALMFVFLKMFRILSVFSKLFESDSSLGDTAVSDLKLKLFIEEKLKR